MTAILMFAGLLLAVAIATVIRDMLLISQRSDMIARVRRRLFAGWFIIAGLTGLELAVIQTIVERI